MTEPRSVTVMSKVSCVGYDCDFRSVTVMSNVSCVTYDRESRSVTVMSKHISSLLSIG